MVVREDHGGGPVGDNIGKNLSRMDLAAVEQADGHNTFLNDFVRAIQGDADEVFLLSAGDVLKQRQHVLDAANLYHLRGNVAACEFKGGE